MTYYHLTGTFYKSRAPFDDGVVVSVVPLCLLMPLFPRICLPGPLVLLHRPSVRRSFNVADLGRSIPHGPCIFHACTRGTWARDNSGIVYIEHSPGLNNKGMTYKRYNQH